LATLVHAIADSQSLALVLYSLAAILGAGAVGYAFSQFNREGIRSLFACTAIVVAISVGVKLIFQIAESFSHPLPVHPGADVLIAVSSLLLYIPALFLIEEVMFRGAVDSHVSHPGEAGGVVSAIYVSSLWSLWHAPIYGWRVAIAAGLIKHGAGRCLPVALLAAHG
jgi:membrane protease YdiL (CAAX protease family)